MIIEAQIQRVKQEIEVMKAKRLKDEGKQKEVNSNV
jgi:hypothetical protein